MDKMQLSFSFQIWSASLMIVTKMCDWDYWPMDKEANLLTMSLHFNIEKTANKYTQDGKSNQPTK